VWNREWSIGTIRPSCGPSSTPPSTWDYTHRVDEYLAWCDDAGEQTALWNPPAVIRWNVDKSYLADLELAGIPVVPTMFVTPDVDVDDGALEGRVVIKPTVGADAKGVAVFDRDVCGARQHINALLDTGRTAMVQAYVGAIDTVGETGLVFLGDEFSHAFRKPALLDGTPAARDDHGVMTYADRTIEAVEATAAELDLGRRIVAYTADRFGPLAYTRIDLVQVGDAPAVLELELTEPSLFLDSDTDATDRAARAFAALIGA